MSKNGHETVLKSMANLKLPESTASPRNGESLSLSDKAALHYIHCKDWKKACKLAGFSDSFIKGRMFQLIHDPNSSLHLALNRIINTGLSELKAKYLTVANDWATFDSNLAAHCATLPKDETLNANVKVGNAISRVHKFLRPELDEQTTIQHTTYQLAVSQMYVDQRKSVSSSTAIDVSQDNLEDWD